MTLGPGSAGDRAAEPGAASGVAYSTTPVVSKAMRRTAQEAYGKLPLYFVENRGQADPRVAYYIQGRDTSVYFTSRGLTFALSGGRAAQPVAVPRLQPASWTAWERPRPSPTAAQRWAVKLDFLGANPDVQPVGVERTPAVISYFKGRPEQWKTGLPTYSRVLYADLWPGIDLVYSGTVDRLKYEFVLKPGATPEQIGLAYRGADSVVVNEAGQLEVSTPAGGFHDEKPYAYQEVGGQRRQVAAAYTLRGASEYGFQVGAYDASRPLVLDPAVLVYAGYIGGSGDDFGHGIAVDGSRNAYVTGQTTSAEATFPETVGPDLTFNGVSDAFVAKVNAAGTALVYAGYIGGSGDDAGFGIAVDGSGNAYVTGRTFSDEATFPVTVGPDLTFNGADVDAFVAKVNAAGTALVYAGYIGGSGNDSGYGIAVDGSGNAYVTGRTTSFEATFPVTVGPDLIYNGGPEGDAFVAKVNAAGTALVYAGYIGGSASDAGYGIAVDRSGNAYVTGGTSSSEATFPETVGPDLIYTGGGEGDAFVAKVNAAGTALVYAGYIGGSGVDLGFGIALDGSGNAYVTGQTSSTEATFPEIVGPDLTINGGIEAFVAKIQDHIPVKIDLKPGANPNCVNPNGGGIVSVAIFGSVTFNVGDINQSTLQFGGASPLRCAPEDALMEGPTGVFSTDGITDLVCRCRGQAVTWPAPGANCGTVSLTGALLSGASIQGSDTACLGRETNCAAGTPIPVP